MLDPVEHQRIIEDLEHIAGVAGVPRRYIEGSMKEYCSADQLAWVSGYSSHAKQGNFGMVMIGPNTAQQMMAITGAFVRNFVDARTVSLQVLLDILKAGEQFDPSVLCIPSFHRSGLPAFQINLLWGLLEDRMLRDRQTLIQVQSIALFVKDYGSHFGQHIDAHFTLSEA